MPEIKKAAQAIQSAREEKEELENQKKSLENRRGYNRAVDIIKKLNTGTITKEQFDNLAEQGGLGDIAEEILSLDAEIQEATKHYLELLAESDKKYHDLVAKYGTLNA